MVGTNDTQGHSQAGAVRHQLRESMMALRGKKIMGGEIKITPIEELVGEVVSAYGPGYIGPAQISRGKVQNGIFVSTDVNETGRAEDAPRVYAIMEDGTIYRFPHCYTIEFQGKPTLNVRGLTKIALGDKK